MGGLVSESSIDTAASTIDDEGLRECIKTMYAARFPAPKEGRGPCYLSVCPGQRSLVTTLGRFPCRALLPIVLSVSLPCRLPAPS